MKPFFPYVLPVVAASKCKAKHGIATVTTVTHVEGNLKNWQLIVLPFFFFLEHNLGFTVLLTMTCNCFCFVKHNYGWCPWSSLSFLYLSWQIHNFHPGKYLLANIPEKSSNLTKILSIIWMRNHNFEGFMSA